MAGLLGFFANMGITKAGGVLEGAAKKWAEYDPETASKVATDEMKADYLRLGAMVADAEPKEEAAHKAVQALEQRLSRTSTAAGVLSGQIDAATAAGNTGLAASLNAQLSTLIEQLTEIGGEPADGSVSGLLFEARQDHALAESDLHELQQFHAGAASKLATAERTIQRAKDDMARAGMQQQVAQERQRRAEELAGLNKGLSGNDIALQAMTQKAAELKKSARAATLNAQGLTHTSETSASADDIVSRTLAGTGTAATSESAQDKLARILGKKAA